MGDALNDPLIGDPRTAQDIHANKLRTDRMGDRQRAPAIVAEHIDAQWQFRLSPHFHGQGGQVGDCMGRNRAGIKRRIAKVLQHQPMDTPCGECVGIAQHMVANRRDITAELRCAGQGRDV